MANHKKVSGGGSPVTLDEFRSWAVITHTQDDNLIQDIILPAATKAVENLTRRAFITQTIEYFLDEFPSVIKLPKTPAASIEYIKYFDTSGVEVTLDASNYVLAASSEPSRIALALNKSWPVTDKRPDGIKVRYSAGVASTNVDNDFKTAVMLFAEHYYENRGLVSYGAATLEVPKTFALFIEPLKVRYINK